MAARAKITREGMEPSRQYTEIGGLAGPLQEWIQRQLLWLLIVTSTVAMIEHDFLLHHRSIIR